MKRAIVCIFAHPDDEAFGPGGTIAKLAKEHDVYILCATKGQKGKNSTGESKKLGEVRAKELIASSRVLGVKKVYFLGFKDGTLNNNLYHSLAGKIEEKLKVLRPELLITFDEKGASGHIDHIVVSMVTCYVFYKLPFVNTLWQHCAKLEYTQQMKDYFIYFPRGYKRSEVDKVVDIRDVWNIKLRAIRTHKSQQHDVDRILRMIKNLPKEDYFLVIKK